MAPYTVFWLFLAPIGSDNEHYVASTRTEPEPFDGSQVTGAPASLAQDPPNLAILHVGPGKPYTTLGDALSAANNLMQTQNVKIVLQPGVYREGGYTVYGNDANRDAVLIIEGASSQNKAIIKGSDVIAPIAWTKRTIEGVTYYETDWNLDWGNDGGPYGKYGPKEVRSHRKEMVYINGELMHQMLIENYDYTWPDAFSGKGNHTFTGIIPPHEVLEPGTFAVAERDNSGDYSNKILVRPPSDVDWGQATVEVAHRGDLLRVLDKNNIVLRNLRFEHSADQLSGYNAAFMVADRWWEDNAPGSQNILIEHVEFVWNNNIGLNFRETSNITLRDVTTNYNGFGGMGGAVMQNMLVENLETSYNNWRGEMSEWRDWAIGGVKIAFDGGDFIFRNHRAFGNMTQGLWFDVHMENIFVERYTGFRNAGHDLFFEISRGPFLVRDSFAANAGKAPLNITTAQHVTVDRSIFYGTSVDGDDGAISYSNDTSRSPYRDDAIPGPYPTGPIKMTNSLMVMQSPAEQSAIILPKGTILIMVRC